MDFARLLGTPVLPALRSVIADWVVTAAEPEGAREADDAAEAAVRRDGGRAPAEGPRDARAVAGRGSIAEKAADLPPATATPAALKAAATGLPVPSLLDPTFGRSTIEAALARLTLADAAEAEAFLASEFAPKPAVVHQRIDTAAATAGEHRVQSDEMTVVTIALGKPDEAAGAGDDGRDKGQDGERRARQHAGPGEPGERALRQPPVDPAMADVSETAAARDQAADAAELGGEVAEADRDLRRFDPDARPGPARDPLRGGFDPAAALERATAAHAAMEPDFGVGGAILNAAMIPGWPPPRPFATAFARELAGGMAADNPIVQEKLLAGLGALGFAARLLAGLRRRLAALRRRPEVLVATGVLFASIMAVMEAAANELEALAEEEEDRDRAIGLSGRFRIDER